MKLIGRDELLATFERDEDFKEYCNKKSVIATKWIPVTERLPKNPAQVLVTYSWGEVTVGEYWNNGEGWGINGEEVLAWMPLPEPYLLETTRNYSKEGAEHETD